MPVTNIGPCACCGGGGIAEFCECNANSISLELGGYAFGTYYTSCDVITDTAFDEGTTEPVLTCGIRPGLISCAIIVNGTTHSSSRTQIARIDCTENALNDIYTTGDITIGVDGFGQPQLTAVFHLGTLGDTGDRGVQVCYFIAKEYYCPGQQDTVDCTVQTPILTKQYEGWLYVYRINLTALCVDFGCPEGTHKITYSWNASTQFYGKVTVFDDRFGDTIGTYEDWDLPGVTGDYVFDDCFPPCNTSFFGSGTSDCMEGCPNPSSSVDVGADSCGNTVSLTSELVI